MKKRFREKQTMVSLGEAKAGLPYKALCRRDGFSEASYYLRRSKRGGMGVPVLYATDPALTVMTPHPNTSLPWYIGLVATARVSSISSCVKPGASQS